MLAPGCTPGRQLWGTLPSCAVPIILIRSKVPHSPGFLPGALSRIAKLLHDLPRSRLQLIYEKGTSSGKRALDKAGGYAPLSEHLLQRKSILSGNNHARACACARARARNLKTGLTGLYRINRIKNLSPFRRVLPNTPTCRSIGEIP